MDTDSVCAVAAGGDAFCWGYDGYGQLGNASVGTSSVPVAVDTSGVLAGQTLIQASLGWYSACAVDSAGAAFCWGDNSYGSLDDGVSDGGSTTPVLTGPQAPAAVTAAPGTPQP